MIKLNKLKKWHTKIILENMLVSTVTTRLYLDFPIIICLRRRAFLYPYSSLHI